MMCFVVSLFLGVVLAGAAEEKKSTGVSDEFQREQFCNLFPERCSDPKSRKRAQIERQKREATGAQLKEGAKVTK